jgi:hypothetical protein
VEKLCDILLVEEETKAGHPMNGINKLITINNSLIGHLSIRLVYLPLIKL